MTTPDWLPPSVDAERPSAARIYDYLLGGAHNFAADRAVADRLISMEPGARKVAALNRSFLRRVVLFLMSQGIRQFLDLGSGIPTVGNVHEIAHEVDPATRVMYVDYEDVAVAHSELILADVDTAQILQADATDPTAVLDAPQTRELLDFDQPIGLLALTLFHYISPAQQPYEMIATYRDTLVPGSHLAVTHFAGDLVRAEADDLVEEMKATQDSVFPRSKDEVTRLFDGFELIEPGIVPISLWRPEFPVDSSENPNEDGLYAGVARKK
jgi:S-adenosyl methyltransferase